MNDYHERKTLSIDQINVEDDEFKKKFVDITKCLFCCQFVLNPKECSGCNILFCLKCIKNYNPSMNKCPKKCTPCLIRDPNRLIKSSLSELIFKCKFSNCDF